jgi:hypothetical protein
MSARIEIPPPSSPAKARIDAVLVWLPQLLVVASAVGLAVVLRTLGVPFPATLPLLSIAATVAALVVRSEFKAQLASRWIAEDHAIRQALAEHGVETQDEAGLAG